MSIPQIENFTSSRGNKVPNQFRVITNEGSYFKSYETMIAAKLNNGKILLDKDNWNYSSTTATYRNQFLGLTTKETQQQIEDGTIELTNLN